MVCPDLGVVCLRTGQNGHLDRGLSRENVEFRGRPDPFVELENHVFASNSEACFPGQRHCLQRFPAIETPAREAVPVKMPTDVHMSPGIDADLKVLFQKRLEVIPMAIIEQGVRKEMGLFQPINRSGMFDSN